MSDSKPTSDSSAIAAPAVRGITQAEFAARRGVSGPLVSKWKAKGLLVLDATGRVLEHESNARLAAALDPGRGGDRTGRQRPSAAPNPATLPTGAQPSGQAAQDPDADRLSYQREAARDKRASAMQRELELARDAGELLPANEVVNRIALHVRQALDVLASRRRRLSPALALESDPRGIELLLEESDREFCQALAGLALPQSSDQVQAA